MAFVSKDCIDAWFSTDSWVYKGFAYLFQNPLWNKRVPRGFSLCPYFWISIFSILLFKPFIVPALLLLGKITRGLITLIGRPALWFDELIRKTCKLETSAGTGLGILLFALVSIPVLLSLCYIVWLKFTALSLMVEALIIFGVSNIAIVIGTSIYTSKNKYNEDRCKAELYALTYFIISVIGLCNVPGVEWQYYLSVTGDFIWAFICMIGQLIWWIGHGIVVGLKWIGMFLRIFLKAIGMLFCALIPFGLLGWAAMKLISKIEFKYKEVTYKERVVTEEDWKYLIYSFCLRNKYTSTFKYNYDLYYTSYDSDFSSDKPLFDITSDYMDKFLHFIVFQKLTIPNVLIKMPYSEFVKIRSKSFDKGFNNLYTLDVTNEIVFRALNLMHDTIMRHLNPCRSTLGEVTKGNVLFEENFREDYEKALTEAQKARDEKSERKYKLREAKHKACKKFTAIPEFIYEKLIWNMGIAPVGRFICKVFKNTGIFIAYMWLVCKNLKQGACPYRTFADPTPTADPKK